MKHGTKRITIHTDWLAAKANEFYEKMEAEYKDFEVISVQVVQLNTCVTMFITYCY